MKTYQSPLLSTYTEIIHAYTTRHDGSSLYGNNLAYHVNDNAIDVNENHIKLATDLQYPIDRLVHMSQRHGDKIVIIDKEHNYQSIPSCDALITKEKEIPLMVMVADCIPILLYDPVQKVIAAVHAGRAGVFSKILPKTIEKMQTQFSSNTKDILISLGPSIHQECYEVGEEIVRESKKLSYEYAIKEKEGRYYLDLLSIIYRQLDDLNMMSANFETSPYCTACNTDDFYSYRAEKNSCGRFAGVIMMK